jgi:Raf kinase inhibitor-like YbhB/YbcL family protein
MTSGCLQLLSIVAFAALILACGDDGAPNQVTQEPPTRNGAPASTLTPGDETVDFSLTSEAFGDGEAIPSRFTCDGEDIWPALSWEGAPDEAQSFALTMDDPDAPGGTFNHWLIYNMDAGARSLSESIDMAERPLEGPNGGFQGRNDFGDIGYGGPCPPGGQSHRYDFRLYALDGLIDVGPGASKEELLAAMEGRTLAVATLTGTYERAE